MTRHCSWHGHHARLKHAAYASLHAGTAGSTHQHVFVERHAPHSHVIIRMCHAGLAFSLLDLPTVQESSAASQKCHFRVRHSGRVCDYPYKSVLMVDRALKAVPCAGSDPPGPSANACSSNGMRVRDQNLQFLATVARHGVARGARFERAIFGSRAPAPAVQDRHRHRLQHQRCTMAREDAMLLAAA